MVARPGNPAGPHGPHHQGIMAGMRGPWPLSFHVNLWPGSLGGSCQGGVWGLGGGGSSRAGQAAWLWLSCHTCSNGSITGHLSRTVSPPLGHSLPGPSALALLSLVPAVCAGTQPWQGRQLSPCRGSVTMSWSLRGRSGRNEKTVPSALNPLWGMTHLLGTQ